MIRDITVGQYLNVESPVHRLDPRTKLLISILFMVLLFMVNNLLVYLPIAVALAVVIYFANIPAIKILKGLKPIVFLVSIAFLMNLFLSHGKSEPIFNFWIFVIYREGAIRAVLMAVRLILLITGTSILTLTTSPIELTDGIEYALNPLKRIGVPAHEIAMMMTIALRFIPTLLEETDKIMKAQQARGADFDTGRITKRAMAMIPLLVPLFISAFRRADELAMAMEARCYRGGVGRTRMKKLRMRSVDYLVMAGFVAFGFLMLMLSSWNIGVSI